MGEKQTAPVVYTFRPTRTAVLVAVAGFVAMVLGFVAPAQATPPGDDGAHKDYVCKYVGKPGVDERLQTGNNPIWVDTAATQGTWFNDGQHRSYVLIADTPKLKPEPDASQCPKPGPPTTTTTTKTHTTTTSTTTKPTTTTTTVPTTTTTTTPTTTTTTATTTTGTATTTTGTATTTTGTATTTTGTATTTTGTATSTTTSPTTTESPDTGGSITTTTTTSPAPIAPGEETPEEGATTPAAPAAPAAEQPEVGNVVPGAATDGADLLAQSWTAQQSLLVGIGVLLLMASGLLSIRRRTED